MTLTYDPTPEVLAEIDRSQDEARHRLFDFLAIPSISAQPDHAGDCAAAARWLAHEFASVGFATEMRQTPGHPIVVGHYPGPDGVDPASLPHILFYGHYDVQPADPLDLWESPPFEPQLVPGPQGPRIVARGAVDDKGQVACFLWACRAWYNTTGGLPIRVTLLLEGEEEVGSANLEAFIAANKSLLKADVALISDTGMWDRTTPALTTRLRGMVYTQIDLVGPDKDLHSGMYGGAALNPINALTKILGDLHDDQGRVQIPGFYKGVDELPPSLAAQWAGLGFDEPAMLASIGLTDPAGETGRSALERMWARPTADLNGIWGGYIGAGAKTVIASHAHAKLSFRLVGKQDPAAIMAGLKQFLAERTPAGAQIKVQDFGGNPAVEVSTEGPFIAAAEAALSEEYGKAPVLMGCGGSIPVVGTLKAQLGLDTILMGFGLDDDQVHSPNEKFEWSCYLGGARSHARLLAKLAALR
ncbi:dipeptidase [Acidisoma cellulosilytica]|uniref:Dipeptidase n=1 Tax=Acidisoma cellulosilyticum TaxID=2802395 RepID=A0A963YZ72_9PROT|nr:dipeptidase [Acidisoma cellulosilyticum]MCB8879579.1 dipeptidase [Acidisoma cellulosilyticum]